jgi:flagellar basal-body rod modification protein FlgD
MVAAVSNTSTSPASSLSAAAAAATGTTQTSAQDQSDRFLKLLVAQLNNQDPMNPMDNAQMTSQMAQINTVAGIQQVNSSIEALTTQLTSLQMLQGASMIGHQVLSTGNTLTIDPATKVGTGSFDLAGNADKVSVQILTAGGQVLDTVNMGQQAAGRLSFNWDASQYGASGALSFKVVASQGSASVSTTPLVRDTVTSVSTDATGMNLTLQGGSTVPYSAIKAIL